MSLYLGNREEIESLQGGKNSNSFLVFESWISPNEGLGK